jgi:hypothetical protein
LVVDADRVLAFAVALQYLEPIGRRHTQIGKTLGRFNGFEFAARDRKDLNRKALRTLTVEYRLRHSILETSDQDRRRLPFASMVSLRDTIVKRNVSLTETIQTALVSTPPRLNPCGCRRI